MEKKLTIFKRKQAQKLYYESGWSIRKIARFLSAGRDNVKRWIKMKPEDIEKDKRGWPKGKRRKYTNEQEERILKIRKELTENESFFWGNEIILHNYISQTGEKVSLWFIDSVLRQRQLVNKRKNKRKGGSKHMNYPSHTVNKLGRCMMSLDFIGPKYLEGSSNKINFLSCKYVRPIKLGIVRKVSGQTTQEVIRTVSDIWDKYYVPHVVKMDNDSAFGGNLSHKESIGRFTLFLLNLGVKPLYIAPRHPWNNSEVEGFNNVFSKKFWNRLKFENEEELDIKINEFNMEYEKYVQVIMAKDMENELASLKKLSHYKDVDITNNKVKHFKENHIYFIRKVRREGKKGSNEEKGVIVILGRKITLKPDLINLFVFCDLSLTDQKLYVYTEIDGELHKEKVLKYVIKNVVY